MDPAERRDFMTVILVVLLGVSALSVIVYLLAPGFLGFMPFLFLFFPIAIPFGWRRGSGSAEAYDESDYCPGCGSPVDPEYDFCTVCGKRLRRCPGRSVGS